MGEVYRATDTNLKRQVAIKVLPSTLATDPERLARFQREAEVLAALNHPNIAHIHGLEKSKGTLALVMELVEGPTLADRIAHGAIPVADALPIAKQIAEALEAAHEQGIIHRDLKPANIKVRADGTVKVLDFGLAKAMDPAGGSSANAMNSPTISVHATQAGTILGTAAYMSPEQAAGNAVDRRSDLWAFGVVLLEMLTGRQVFKGETVSHVLAAVLKDEPEWATLPANTPPSIRKLLRRCLEKDRKHRLDSAADARLDIDDALAGSSADVNLVNLTSIREREHQLRLARGIAVGALVVAAVSTGLALFAWTRSTAAPWAQPPVRLLLFEQLPAQTADPQRSFAISPDGSRVVYVAESGGARRLYVREMRSIEATPIAGTDGAQFPFFSPDGRRIGFFADAKVQVLALTGGAPIVLADVTNPRGATWAPDDTIIYSPATDSGLWQVSAAGGTPRELAQPDSSKGERGYRWPELLPGGDAVLFTVATSDIPSFDEARIAVRSLRTGEQHELIRGGTFATFAATGHLLYARAGALLAAPFDARRLTMTGAARPVLDGIVTYPFTGAAQYALSPNGTLLYVAGKPVSQEAALSWVDRSGRTSRLAVAPAAYQGLSISPDGRRAALNIDGANANVWILNLDRTTVTRLTHEWNNSGALWTPDGTRVTFASARGGVRTLFWQRVDGQGEAEPVFPSGQFAAQVTQASSWTRDGRTAIFDARSSRTGLDLWVVGLDGDRTPKPLMQTSFNEMQPAVSPDGRWLAYVSNETGRSEVYVQPFPGPGSKTRISTDGGLRPVWARSGLELFYRNGDAMMAVKIETSPSFSPGRPQLLFRKASTFPYDVASDGRFLMIETLPSETAARPVTVVLNWLQELHPSLVAK